jgi:hypothetical protein
MGNGYWSWVTAFALDARGTFFSPPGEWKPEEGCADVKTCLQMHRFYHHPMNDSSGTTRFCELFHWNS